MSPTSRDAAASLRPSDREAGSLLPNLPTRSRILLIRLRSIGDIVLLTPALALLKAWRGDLALSVLVESRFRELLEGNPDVDEVLALDRPKGLRRAAAQFRLVRELRRRPFALCLNLHGGPRSAGLTALSGARWKAGLYQFRWQRIYDFLVPDTRLILQHDAVHTAELQAAALYWLGLPPAAIPPAKIVVKPEHRNWWRAERTRFALEPGQEYSVLHPTALYATKQWAPEKFAEIGAYLEREAGLLTLYSCGPGESGVIDDVERAARRPLRRLEGASLGQFAAALGEARLFVGNDSGPAHMASALGRPAVVIFGSSSSQIWGPWPRPARSGAGLSLRAPGETPSRQGRQLARVVQNYYECNPCPGDRCYRFERPECILSVSVEQVREAIRVVLGEQRRG